MDVEAFSNDDFDAVSWINSSYANSDSKDKEIFVSSLVSKLQLYVQQVNSVLEETSQQILTNLPKVMKDSHNLQNEVCSLKEKMTEVQKEIAHVQEETGECMSNLERLDALTTKLQSAKQGLLESDGWGKLVSELEDLFEKNDINLICEKLNSLQKSFMAQDGLPGQLERESQIEGFRNRLEALASPSVVHCFSQGNIEESRKYVDIFSKMNRLPQLTQYYRTIQKTQLQQKWSDIVNLSESSNNFLKEYYELLMENYQKQVNWCVQVFGDKANAEPLVVVIELLSSLQPSRENVILNTLKESNEKLEVLQEFSSANIYFGNILRVQLGASGGTLLKQYSKKLSKVIFDYFNTFLFQYAAIEQNFLAQSVANLNVMQQSAAETVRALGNANKKIVEWTNNASQRCKEITQNYAIVPLTIVLTSVLKSFIEKYKKAQQQLSASKKIEQNWSLLQSSMSLLQSLGDFKISLQQFEKEISDKIIEVYENLYTDENSAFFGYKLIEKRDINDLKRIALKIKENRDKSVTADGQEFIIFNSVYEMIKPICSEIHDTTLAAVFSPIEKQLSNVEPPETFTITVGADLPDYSYAPQEFITQIGQYLLTLPQHLEPLLLAPSKSLKEALEISDLKYKENTPSADILLALVVEECCVMYQNQITQIKCLNNTSAKQIAKDIEYIENVLEELGIPLGKYLQQIKILLRASPENYLASSSGCEPRLVTAIRQMRNILSAE